MGGCGCTTQGWGSDAPGRWRGNVTVALLRFVVLDAQVFKLNPLSRQPLADLEHHRLLWVIIGQLLCQSQVRGTGV